MRNYIKFRVIICLILAVLSLIGVPIFTIVFLKESILEGILLGGGISLLMIFVAWINYRLLKDE